jgi:hypothetical protein
MRFFKKSFNINKKAVQGHAMFNQTLSTEQQHVSDIFMRLCTLCQVQNNLELEQHLSLQLGFCEQSIELATVPYELIDKLAKASEVSFDSLLNGSNQTTAVLDGPVLQAVSNGIIKSIKKLSMAGLIKGENQTQEALSQLADIQLKQIAKELKIQSQVK